MAFEAFRTQDRRPKTLRRVVIAIAAVFHGALIAAGVVYSYWHVDELMPPTLRVTFISAAPPPPPSASAPAGGGGAKKKLAMKPKPTTPVVVPKLTEVVQPRERPAPVKKEFRKQVDEEDDEDDAPKGQVGGVKGGVAGGIQGGVIGGEVGGTLGGTKGGTIGGTLGGTGAAPVAAKLLAPNIGASQRQNCPKPDFPAVVRRSGVSHLIGAKICVSKTGAVESVTILRHGDPLLENSVIASEKACRYNPWMIGGTAAPFCYPQTFEFKGE